MKWSRSERSINGGQRIMEFGFAHDAADDPSGYRNTSFSSIVLV
ncbi:hypothetical protein RMSM_07288 [Rhodopirellula maiorica SM1]|uniref:Uncharacterized protein n=1 Tax=Rhodopirellula maiorica SM1 TaxID=1265738 RepID=M5R9U0_9BACT|nr:hypothetical protein RMSM_07288 [Rhodopirellula maiorica SM1]